MQINLSQRIELLVKLGQYLKGKNDNWQEIQQKTSVANGWFLPEFIDLAINNIITRFLQKDTLENWIAQYPRIKDVNNQPKIVGIVMAGNIPLVGFHDFLCVFIAGHRALIKASSKDEVLIKHIVGKLIEWEPQLKTEIAFSEMLKNCDAYIATGSNSSAGFFDYYFGKYPNIIRRNRTSVAVLTGDETRGELEALTDDVHLYFGMGCRNITKVYVPRNYDFEPLINVFKKYEYLSDVHKYKNNYDYNLALHVLNKKYYMSTPALLIIEDESIFSPVSQLNYEYYSSIDEVKRKLKDHDSIQCIVGTGFVPFGQAQCPAVDQYADGVDTLKFLSEL